MRYLLLLGFLSMASAVGDADGVPQGPIDCDTPGVIHAAMYGRVLSGCPEGESDKQCAADWASDNVLSTIVQTQTNKKCVSGPSFDDYSYSASSREDCARKCGNKARSQLDISGQIKRHYATWNEGAIVAPKCNCRDINDDCFRYGVNVNDDYRDVLVIDSYFPKADVPILDGSVYSSSNCAAGDIVCGANVCTCSNGNGATGTNCTTHGDEICASCNGGYYLGGNQCASCGAGKHQTADMFTGDSCIQNTCTCSNGNEATGTNCTTDGDEICASCNAGYYGDQCALKTCTCSGGTAATGTACPNDGDAKCASCDAGYYESGNACALKTCTCSNGTAATGTDCPNDGDAKCASCDDGYYQSGDACALKTCTCPNGSPATGTDCPTNGGAKCASCDDGHTDKQCAADWASDNVLSTLVETQTYKKCVSGNDYNYAASSREDCARKCGNKARSQLDISGQIKRHYATWYRDYPDQYQCKCRDINDDCFRYGNPYDSSYRDVLVIDSYFPKADVPILDGSVYSSSNCAAGDIVCGANVCTCSNGNGATGTDCTTHGDEICASCNDGYYLGGNQCAACGAGKRQTDSLFTGDSCTQNECTCSNGNEATGTNCTTDGSEICASCNDGYYLGGNQCAACGAGKRQTDSLFTGDSCTQNECTCSNGNEATGTDCTTDGSEICASCNGGYYLNGTACLVHTPCGPGFGVPEDLVDNLPVDAAFSCKACVGTDHKFSNLTDFSSCAQHTICPAGYEPDRSKDGESNPGCVPCGAGNFTNDINYAFCTEKQCICPGGTGTTGTACPTHDSEMCASCTGNRYLSNGACPSWTVCSGAQYESTSPSNTQNRVCATKNCTCPGGTGATGTDCPTHDSEMCAACDAGYYLDGNACAENQCTCYDGIGANGTACPTITAKCASCDAGYYLSDDQCTACEPHEHQSLTGDSCTQNDCTCSGGTGATGTDCTTHGAEICASCYAGYYGDQCALKTCTCSNGTAATGTDCPNNGDAKCVSCDAGYYLPRIRRQYGITCLPCPTGVYKVGSEVTGGVYDLPAAPQCPNYTVDLSEASGLDDPELPSGVCPTPGTSVKYGALAERHEIYSKSDGSNCQNVTNDLSDAISLFLPGSRQEFLPFVHFGICPTPGTSVRLGSHLTGHIPGLPTASQCPGYTVDLSAATSLDSFELPEGVCYTPGTPVLGTVHANCPCGENQRVKDGACEDCPAFAFRPAGDDPAGNNTYCTGYEYDELEAPPGGGTNYCENEGWAWILSIDECEHAYHEVTGGNKNAVVGGTSDNHGCALDGNKLSVRNDMWLSNCSGSKCYCKKSKLLCDPGTHEEGVTCVSNTCTCSNGTAATDIACTTDGSAKCASCNTGYYQDGIACATCPTGVYKVGSEVTGSLLQILHIYYAQCPDYTVDLSEASGLSHIQSQTGVCPTPGTSVKVGPLVTQMHGYFATSITPCQEFMFDLSDATGLIELDYPLFEHWSICPTPGTSVRLGSDFTGMGTYISSLDSNRVPIFSSKELPTATQCPGYTVDLSETSLESFELPEGVCYTPGTPVLGVFDTICCDGLQEEFEAKCGCSGPGGAICDSLSSIYQSNCGCD